METLIHEKPRNLMLPVINDLEIIKRDDNEYVDLFLGTKERGKYEECLQKIIKEAAATNSIPVNHWDFRNKTTLQEKVWLIDRGVNVYINHDCKKETSLVDSEKETGYEAEFWYTGKKQ